SEGGQLFRTGEDTESGGGRKPDLNLPPPEPRFGGMPSAHVRLHTSLSGREDPLIRLSAPLRDTVRRRCYMRCYILTSSRASVYGSCRERREDGGPQVRGGEEPLGFVDEEIDAAVQAVGRDSVLHQAPDTLDGIVLMSAVLRQPEEAEAGVLRPSL